MAKIAIVYWSGTGNTEIMAKEIGAGAKGAGAEISLLTASEFTPANVEAFDKFAFGCPSMGAEVLEEEEFEPMFAQVEALLAGKEVALFGSYGWGDGEWMRDWETRCIEKGIVLVGGKGLILNETPDDAGEALCRELGEKLAS